MAFSSVLPVRDRGADRSQCIMQICFVAGVIARVLFSTVIGYSSMNTAYWREMGYIYLGRRIFTNRLADLLNCTLK